MDGWLIYLDDNILSLFSFLSPLSTHPFLLQVVSGSVIFDIGDVADKVSKGLCGFVCASHY